jgi:hypothetical protein
MCFLRKRLKLDVKDGFLRLEQNHRIGTNWVEGEFGGLDLGQGDRFSQQPTGKIG